MGHQLLEDFRANHQDDIMRADQLIWEYAEGANEDMLPSTIIDWFIGINIGSLRHRATILRQLGKDEYNNVFNGIYQDLGGDNKLISRTRESWQSDAADAFFEHFAGSDGTNVRGYVESVRRKFYDHAEALENQVNALRTARDNVYHACHNHIAGVDAEYCRNIAFQMVTFGLGTWQKSLADAVVSALNIYAASAAQSNAVSAVAAYSHTTDSEGAYRIHPEFDVPVECGVETPNLDGAW